MTLSLNDQILLAAERAAEAGVSLEDFLSMCEDAFEYVHMDSGDE